MCVGRSATRDRRHCWSGRCGDDSDRRACLRWCCKRVRVGKAVRITKTLCDADVPRKQCHILQMVSGSACVSDKGLRCGKIVLGVGVRGFEKKVGSSDVCAPAASLFARARHGTQPTAEGISRSRDVVAVKQRVVEGIVDELRKLLCEWLHVAVFDDDRRGTKIRTEYERVSGGGVDSMRPPRAAERCIAFGVVGSVVRHGNDELAVLFR